jgi:hypothetical protein
MVNEKVGKHHRQQVHSIEESRTVSRPSSIVRARADNERYPHRHCYRSIVIPAVDWLPLCPLHQLNLNE